MTEQCSTVEGGLWGCIVVASAFFIQVLAFGTSQSIGVYNIELLRYFKSGAAAISLVGSINLGVFLGAALISSQFLAFGTAQSIGVYNIEFLRYFDTNAAQVSLVGSIHMGVVLGTGPLASLLMTRWSHRQVALLGAVLSNIGLVCMPFAPNLAYMYVFYGIVTGVGYSLVYIPSHVLSGLYFLKHRSLATAIATAGSGMGAAVFPIVMYHIIEHYGWRGSLFIVAGVNLHLLIFAALLRPVPKNLLRSLAATEELQNLNENKCGPSNELSESPINGADCPACTNGDAKHESSNDCVQEQTVMLPTRQKSNTIARLRKHFKAVFTMDFIIFWLSNICWNAGGAIVLIFFPEYAYSVGMSKQDASTAYTIVGAGSCIGCILGGILGNSRHINRMALYMLGNLGAGLVTLLLPWKVLHTMIGLSMICLIFGLMFGIILGMLVVVTSDLLGTEALGDGFGYLMLANGIGVFSGPPVAGLLIDMYGDHDPAMYLSGVLTICGGLTMCGVCIRRRLSSRPMGKQITVIVD